MWAYRDGSSEWIMSAIVDPSDPRTPVDILIRDMGGDGVGQGVDFTGEVVVFLVHLCVRRSPMRA